MNAQQKTNEYYNEMMKNSLFPNTSEIIISQIGYKNESLSDAITFSCVLDFIKKEFDVDTEKFYEEGVLKIKPIFQFFEFIHRKFLDDKTYKEIKGDEILKVLNKDAAADELMLSIQPVAIINKKMPQPQVVTTLQKCLTEEQLEVVKEMEQQLREEELEVQKLIVPENYIIPNDTFFYEKAINLYFYNQVQKQISEKLGLKSNNSQIDVISPYKPLVPREVISFKSSTKNIKRVCRLLPAEQRDNLMKLLGIESMKQLDKRIDEDKEKIIDKISGLFD